MHLPPNFLPLWSAPEGAAELGLWFVFSEGKLLLQEPIAETLEPSLPHGRAPVGISRQFCFGSLDGQLCWAAQAEKTELPPRHIWETLRSQFDRLPDTLVALAGRASQFLDFDRTHRFCGACGTRLEDGDSHRARRCPSCEAIFYPRIAPAMMVLISRQGESGRELLLARGNRFPAAFYSALAGFLEPSETLEQCVKREVAEEVGLEIGELRYFGSQFWPFPHSLMLGFFAEYKSGEIRCQEGEILDAQWFPIEHLPELPHRLSLARKLIEAARLEAAPGTRLGELSPQ